MKRLVLLFSALLMLFVQKALAQNVKISELNDIDAGTWSGESGNIIKADDLCIFSTSGNYNVTASGDGPGGRFRLFNGPAFINYSVRWNDEAATSSGQANLTRNVALAGQTGASTTDDDCNSGTNLNARVEVRFNQGQLQRRTSGSYAGTLTLTIGFE